MTRSYPTSTPTNKHDLIGPWPLPSSELVSSDLASTESIFESMKRTDKNQNPERKPKLICCVYTYSDAPLSPKPLSRMMDIIGYIDGTSNFLRKLTLSPEDDDKDSLLPSCITRCDMGVKRADGRHRSNLNPNNLTQSENFATLMRTLRRLGAAALIRPDSRGRFCILRPLNRSDNDHADAEEDFRKEDFAASCYVGNVDQVQSYLAKPEQFPIPNQNDGTTTTSTDLWQPPGTDSMDTSAGLGTAMDQSDTAALWQPPGSDYATVEGNSEAFASSWNTTSDSLSTTKQPLSLDGTAFLDQDEEKRNHFHSDSGAAAADAFYSGLTRTLDTRADSRLYHMRSFNGWVKATQIAELDPSTKRTNNNKRKPKPLRVLDLACGKGGDLGKWTLHKRGIENYVGVDVARGSLRDAAIRARKMKKQLRNRCTFTCADLGADVPGRPKSPSSTRLQKLLTWSMQNETDSSSDPKFEMMPGGGISPSDKFDVVSIQFAIHYMMSSRKRARRFFHTVSSLLDVGGNLIATTIDARVALDHLMGKSIQYDRYFEQNTQEGHLEDDEKVVVKVGGGACCLKFEHKTVQKLFSASKSAVQGTDGDLNEDLFGLEYTFTLVEGSDHAAGVGEAVDLPEWLTPLPALTQLANEAGMELEYATNFHEFYHQRKDRSQHPMAHNALYNMKVLDRNGSISKHEWEISRLYAAIKFCKVRESKGVLDDDDGNNSEDSEEEQNSSGNHGSKVATTTDKNRKKLLPVAMMKAKKVSGDMWTSLSSEEKKQRTNEELEKML